MIAKLPGAWMPYLNEELEKDYFKDLRRFVLLEYQAYQCYPPGREIFRAFELCTPENLKVVIIGQDPYHGEGQANGLCFSVNPGIAHPPSLTNIFKEIQTDLKAEYPVSGDLSSWARQGVLLLNATLTVRRSEAGSHQRKGWEQFTDQVIRHISEEFRNVVFLLWGGYAKKKKKLINSQNHYVLTSGHPSPLSANRGYWFGNGHFSKCNDFLVQQGKAPITWL